MLQLKILVVEDDLLLQEEIKLGLEIMGCTIELASSGFTAISLFKKFAPDLILMDINLEGEMDGIETAIELSKINSVPLIFISDLSDGQTVIRGEKCKPMDYLTKPFTQKQLLVSIERAVFSFNENNLDKTNTDAESKTNVFGDSIFVKAGTENFISTRVRFNDIYFLKANRAYCWLHTKENQYHLSFPLKKMLEKLPKEQLLKISNSCAVNPNHISGVKGNNLLINGQSLRVTNPKIIENLLRV